MVQVQQHDAHHVAIASGPGNGLLNAVVEQVAVGQAGQAIVVGLVLQCVLVAHALADIVDDADKMGGCTAGQVTHWRYMQLVPEQRAVFAVVAQCGLAFALLAQRRPYVVQIRLGQIVAHQKPPFQANHLFGAVAGDALERRIDIDDGVVVFIAAGDHDSVAARRQGLFVQVAGLCVVGTAQFAVADVFLDHDQVRVLAVRIAQRGHHLTLPIDAAVLALALYVAIPAVAHMLR